MKFQGYCQGSGSAPAGWAIITVVILRAHKHKGHGAKFVCPVSRKVSKLAAILFVDNTDIIHMRIDLGEVPRMHIWQSSRALTAGAASSWQQAAPSSQKSASPTL